MKTILVVDDSRIMRNIVKNMLAEFKIPCQYIEAGDGEEALTKLLGEKINLVLLDWNMPRLSGLAFLKKVRNMDEYKNLPIIMVTSESARYEVIEALKEGATDYIVKPINEQVFLHKIRKFLMN